MTWVRRMMSALIVILIVILFAMLFTGFLAVCIGKMNA